MALALSCVSQHIGDIWTHPLTCHKTLVNYLLVFFVPVLPNKLNCTNMQTSLEIVKGHCKQTPPCQTQLYSVMDCSCADVFGLK